MATTGPLYIDLYYDVVSPYSFLAFEVFTRYIKHKKWNIQLTLKPIFLGGVMQTTGNRPPAELPQRAPYLLKDIQRNGSYFGIKLRQPSKFPLSTLNPMRLLTAAPQHVEALSRRFWLMYWCEDVDISEKSALVQALTDIGIPESQRNQFLEAMNTTEVKETLKNLTQEATDRGSFGAPTYFVKKSPNGDAEMFFGSDRFPVFCHLFGLPWYGPNPEATQLAKL